MNIRAITVVMLTCVSVALAGQRDESKYTDTAEKTAKELRHRIQTAVNALTNHPWAGEYYCGDGLGMNVSLLLAPGAGYVFEWHGCLGLYDRNYGNLTETNGTIRLSFTFKNERKGFRGIAGELTPVPWGKRRYLVPSDEIIGFCKDVNDGREPRDDIHGLYLLRSGDENERVTGMPTVPECYRAQLLPRTSDSVRVRDRTMTFDEALPMLTKMLDGDVNQATEALGCLFYYGDTALNTEAINRVVKIASATNVFPNYDHILNLAYEERGDYRKKPRTDAVNAEAVLFKLQMSALTVVLNSGVDKDRTLLRRYLESASVTERYMLQSARGLVDLRWSRTRLMRSTARMPDLQKIFEEERTKPDIIPVFDL